MADNKNKTPFYLIDTRSAFYKPLSTRLVICIAVVIWAAMEGWHRDPFWSVISLACAVYCVYVLFWAYQPPVDPPPLPAEPEEEPDDAETAAIVPAEDEKPKV